MATKTASSLKTLSSIENFLIKVGSSKYGEEANTEPGSQGGATEHPVKSVEDGTQNAPEGSRAKENTTDVKEDQGKPAVVDSPMPKAAFESPEVPSGTAADDQIQIGLNKQPTGEDPSNETKGAKGGKDDPGSTHPARTDNNELEGGKYAYDEKTSLAKIAADIKQLSSTICDQIHSMSQGTKTASTPAPKSSGQPAQAKQALDNDIAYQAGWEMAGLANGTMDKQAVDQLVHSTLTQIIKEAEEDAAEVCGCLREFEEVQKRAHEEAQRGSAQGRTAQKRADDMSGGMGGGMDQEALMQALGGAGGGMPAGAGGEMTGGMGGETPMAGEGGGGGGEGGEGGEGQEAEIQELMALLQQLGMTPEELEQALQAQAGDSGAGELAGAGAGEGNVGSEGGPGGMPPKMGSARQGQKRAGSKVAASEMRNYLTELLQRSRLSRAG